LYPRLIRINNKKTEKFSELWQNFHSTVFLNCVPLKNSEEKSAEILPESSTKKIVRKNLWILNFLNLTENFSEFRFFLSSARLTGW
jgi:hypothetical protein